MSKTLKSFFCLSILLFFTGCNHNKKLPLNKNWETINTWSFKGKMAINDGLNNGSGRVKWLGTKHSIEAQFKAPLGQGSWTINETAANATLISSVNGESMAETAQELISYELGWHFPWNKLQYWLRGHQSDQAIQKIVKPKQSFTDSQWRIEFTQWTQTSLGLLPKKIKAIKAPYSVKLVIYDWQFE